MTAEGRRSPTGQRKSAPSGVSCQLRRDSGDSGNYGVFPSTKLVSLLVFGRIPVAIPEERRWSKEGTCLWTQVGGTISAVNRAQRVVLVLYCSLLAYCCVWIPWCISNRYVVCERVGYGEKKTKAKSRSLDKKPL
jgi:hypothetical protein